MNIYIWKVLVPSIALISVNSVLAAISGVTVFEHINHDGISETITSNAPDLRNNTIGNDVVSSLHVPIGWCGYTL